MKVHGATLATNKIKGAGRSPTWLTDRKALANEPDDFCRRDSRR